MFCVSVCFILLAALQLNFSMRIEWNCKRMGGFVWKSQFPWHSFEYSQYKYFRKSSNCPNDFHSYYLSLANVMKSTLNWNLRKQILCQTVKLAKVPYLWFILLFALGFCIDSNNMGPSYFPCIQLMALKSDNNCRQFKLNIRMSWDKNIMKLAQYKRALKLDSIFISRIDHFNV